MPIKVSCHCGQSFTAKDELVGQTLLCPKCHQPLTIGAEQQQTTRSSSGNRMEDLFEEAGLKEVKGLRCPQCGTGLQANAVLCVQCGYNLQTGQKVKGAKFRTMDQRGHNEAADVMLEQASVRIAEDQLEEKKNRAQGAPLWVYFIALVLVVAFGLTMLLMPKDQAFQITGFGTIGLGTLMSFVYGIRILIVAFKENVVQGILCLFVPFYSLFYIITRWSQVGTFFLMQIVAGFVAGAGWGLIAMSPMLKAETKQAWLPLPAQPQVVVSLPAEDAGSLERDLG